MKPLAALLFATLLVLTAPAWAELDRDEAAQMARQASGGRVLAVDSVEHDARSLWRVKVLTPQGEVKVILIDAERGRPRRSR